MGLFNRLNRNRKKTVLPTEVDEYYRSEMRTRRSTSVLFALFALIVTLVVAAGLFFGGRAIYRALSNDNDNQAQIDENKDKSSDKGTQSGSNTENSSSSQTQGQNGGSASGGSNSASSTSSSSTNTAPSTPGGSSISTPSSVPATGDEPAALPHTGD